MPTGRPWCPGAGERGGALDAGPSRKPAPAASRKAAWYRLDTSLHIAFRNQVNRLEARASTSRVVLIRLPVSRSEDVSPVLRGLESVRVEALIVVSDPLFSAHPQEIAETTTAASVPTMFLSRDWIDVGGLIAYEPDFGELMERASFYVSRILRGARPADLPIEQPTKFTLTVNLKTAKALRRTIPPLILMRADEVIR